MDGHMESRQMTYLRMKLDNVRQLIKDHADKEDVLFEMLRTALEDE